MTKLSLNFKFIIAITFVISQSFISCNGDDIVDIGGLLEEETIEEIIDEQVGEEIEEIEEEEEPEEEEEVVNGVSLPVTIDLTDLGIEREDTFFSVDGFNFINKGSISREEPIFGLSGEPDPEFDRSTLGLVGGVSLDLSDINNISTISTEVKSSRENVFIRTFNKRNLVDQITFFDLSSSKQTISIDVEGSEIDEVLIGGAVPEFFSITLE